MSGAAGKGPAKGTPRRVPLPAREWLDVSDVASLLGVTERAVRQRIARRQLPFRHDGARVRFRLSELSDYLDKLPGCSVSEALSNSTGERDR